MDFGALRKREFPTLDRMGQVYLDYTGSGLYSKWQINQHLQYLSKNVLGNPHTFSPSSIVSTEQIEKARDEVLEFFNADKEEYEVIFTQNATAALKLVGESYPFNSNSVYVLTSDNHNSVNGIREYAIQKGAGIKYVPMNFKDEGNEIVDHLPSVKKGANNLFAFPAQSNFSGTKYPLGWIELAHLKKYDVILDAAAFVPTNRLDLKEVTPDFVPISFYKMFGYPTGVGALIARKAAISKLRRPWFSGGTIDLVTTQHISHHLVEGPQAFEDGTPNFLAISAVPIGLTFLKRIGIDNIHDHVTKLSTKLIKALKEMKHSNGRPMVMLYSPKNQSQIGSTIAFNLLTPSGTIIDSRLVGKIAKENNISLRVGCFCNPGSGEHFFEYSEDAEKECFKKFSKTAFSPEKFSKCVGGSASGAVRVSLGIATNEQDITKLITVLNTLKDCPEDVDKLEPLPTLSC